MLLYSTKKKLNSIKTKETEINSLKSQSEENNNKNSLVYYQILEKSGEKKLVQILLKSSITDFINDTFFFN